MILKELKDNRDSIIAKITEQAGEEHVKEIMQIMANGVDCCDSIEELIEGSINIFEQSENKSRRKVTNLAELVGKINELDEK